MVERPRSAVAMAGPPQAKRHPGRSSALVPTDLDEVAVSTSSSAAAEASVSSAVAAVCLGDSTAAPASAAGPAPGALSMSRDVSLVDRQ